tara:strand:+ start:787 stop:1278 length:492 start_codon:yes stop_codon:yes gene_type:complete
MPAVNEYLKKILEVAQESTPPSVSEEKESAIYDRSYGAGNVSFSSPVFDIANNEIYNDSTDIVKVSNQKITLKAGSKYKVQVFLNCTCIFSSGYVDYQLFSATNNNFTGVKGTVILTDNGGNSGSVVQPVGFIKDNGDIDVEVHFNGGDDVTGYYLAVVIQKL